MLVHQAKTTARQWVHDVAASMPGFRGAFFHGSINDLPGDAVLPATSDVDVMLVLAEPPSVKLGKFLHDGVLLEVSHLAEAQVHSAEEVLGQYHLAPSFRTMGIIADPTRRLSEIYAVIDRDFAKRRWVFKRCVQAQDKIKRYCQRLEERQPFQAQATQWLFATGLTTHPLLVAGLRNPTVRKRYVAAKQLLVDYGHLDFHEELLALLGCAGMTPPRIEHHLNAMTEAFDAAKAVVKTPVFFASDISDLARPIAVDGSRELVEQGLHREAVFWIAVTYARCQQIFYEDAPGLHEQFLPGFQALLADLGITAPGDFARRAVETEAFLPRVCKVAAAIVDENPWVID